MDQTVICCSSSSQLGMPLTYIYMLVVLETHSLQLVFLLLIILR
jgi:hypothetical protein